MNRKKLVTDSIVVGFALFAMFFGAGNVVFPPYIGMHAGEQWANGFLFYFIADIGLALVAMFAILHAGGADNITGRIGHVASKVLMCAVILCIGPMVAIPRTAATTLEMSVTPFFSGMSPVVFSIIFFAVILLLSIKQSAVIDIVGKILTPALLIGLLVLIVKGVMDPIGPVPDRVLVDNVPFTGIEAGYQTMDVLATMVFGIIVLKSAKSKGHDGKSMFRVVAGAGVVAGAALLVVYLGLTYLGVTMSRFFDLSVLRTFLVVAIVRNLMGYAGIVLFSVVVALACVTTAVALVSSAAGYFSTLSGGRLRYSWLAAAICLFSAVVSCIGLDQIVSIASPVLSIVYPPTLVLIFLSFFDRHIRSDWVFRMAALGALLTSLLTTAADFGASLPFLARLPLAEFGFGWVLPAAVCGFIGALIERKEV